MRTRTGTQRDPTTLWSLWLLVLTKKDQVQAQERNTVKHLVLGQLPNCPIKFVHLEMFRMPIDRFVRQYLFGLYLIISRG